MKAFVFYSIKTIGPATGTDVGLLNIEGFWLLLQASGMPLTYDNASDIFLNEAYKVRTGRAAMQAIKCTNPNPNS